jgi:isopentenyl-diphosphate delta-isomerase
MDEYLDLVDENDNVIGRKLRSEVYAEGLSNFRVINAFVKNSHGELWVPRRGPNKRIFPNALDMSVGGHVESGEDYDTSFARETKEEINVDIAKVPWKFLGKLTPQEHGVSAFMQVYEISCEEVPSYNPDDFTGFYWLTPEALLERIHSGDKTKGDLLKLVQRFFPTTR